MTTGYRVNLSVYTIIFEVKLSLNPLLCTDLFSLCKYGGGAILYFTYECAAGQNNTLSHSSNVIAANVYETAL